MKNQADLYNSYEKWKGWNNTFAYNSIDARYFSGEMRDCKIKDARVLEIGFGSGDFLAWAKEQGAQVAGTEINPAMLEAANEYGLKILPSELDTVAHEYADYFDTIVAFDVFEHLSIDEIASQLQTIEKMLCPGGHLLLRFPNGQSPFGLLDQHGDPTHKTALSRKIFRCLIQPYKLEIVRYAPSYRVGITSFGIRSGVLTGLRYLMQNIISGILNFIYAQNIPWDPVVVLVIRKPSQ